MVKSYRHIICFVGVFLLCLVSVDLLAQCPMCRMSAESNLANGGDAARGLNRGILYLFALPYLMIFTLAYLWWRNNRKTKANLD